MSFFKTASADILGTYGSKSRMSSEKIAALKSFDDWDNYTAKDDYLYVRVRAISSRVNKNHDGWPSDELQKAYRTFIGKPLFVDHNNSDPSRARGVVVDAKLHVDDDPKKRASLDPYYASAPKNHMPPTWIELLLEVDAKSFPRLAKAIINKDIDGVSMGANVEFTVCSHCKNKAHDPSEFCSHIRAKGAHHDIKLADGTKTSKASYEDCHGVGFFELSFVFDPADETALIRDLKHAKVASMKAAVDEEWVAKYAYSDVFGGLTFDGYIKQIAKEAWSKAIIKPAPDPESNAWNAVQMAIRKAGFPHEAAEIANDMRAEFERENAPVDAMPEQQRGYDTPYDLNPSMEEISPSMREMMMQMPNNSANPTLSHVKEAINPPPQIDLTTVPQKVDTLREEKPCALCGNSMESGKCPTCGYEDPPEGLDNPDLTKANPQIDNVVESQPVPQEGQQGAPPGQAPQNVVPSGGLPANGMGQGGSMSMAGSWNKMGTVYTADFLGQNDPWEYISNLLESDGGYLIDDIYEGHAMTIREILDEAGLPTNQENIRQLMQMAEQRLQQPQQPQQDPTFINSPNDGDSAQHIDNMVMNASFGTLFIDPALLTNEKTAATPNLSGGRINSIEKPLLPLSRTVSDRPKNQRTVSDSTKPITSKTHKDNTN